ncbi:MAG: hypothetical protein PHE51_00260 [Eubacteriales bacterium]|nr:hypothetical protein [Eubacteriales bacterium]
MKKFVIPVAALAVVLSMMTVAMADTLTLMPPTDCQKYKPKAARTTTVYAVETKNTYMACKVDVPVDEFDAAYLFINQSYAFLPDKFEVGNLSKGVKIDKKYLIEGYIVFNMKDYRSILEKSSPNRLCMAVQKTDGTVVFSNVVLIVIDSGDMAIEATQSGDMVVFSLEEGFLPADPASITLKANGKDMKYHYNDYTNEITAFIIPDGESTVSVELSVADLKGTISKSSAVFNVSDLVKDVKGNLTRIQLAQYIYSLMKYELPATPFKFADLDYIPYSARSMTTALKNNGVMNEYDRSFKPNDIATCGMLANALKAIVGRDIYTPANPSAPISLDETLHVLTEAIDEIY